MPRQEHEKPICRQSEIWNLQKNVADRIEAYMEGK